MAHLVIIDGHAIAHRAYHSIPPLTKDGQPVNAIYGFYSMLLSALDTLNPDYLVVCLDSPGPNFRNQEFVGYRAKRTPPDFALISQLPLLPKTLDTAAVTNFAMGGYEADDLIATLTSKALRKKFKKNPKKIVSKVTIITGDKDLMQLVNDKVSLFVPVRGLSETKLYGPVEVKEKLGVAPNQVVDLKALMGDMSDNYPGVAGIGPKTAENLLSKYQTLDNIYFHLDEIAPGPREKLAKDKDNAYLSQMLAMLVSNIPLKFSLSSTKVKPQTYIALDSLFQEYGFKSLSARLRRRYGELISPKVVKPKLDPNQTSFF